MTRNTVVLIDSSEFFLGHQQVTSLLLDPIDGLPLIPDDVQDRLQQISIEHKVCCCTGTHLA